MTQWMEWKVPLGQMEGMGGTQHVVQPVQRARPEEPGISRPGAAWLAGVRQERWLNWVRQPGLAWVLPGPGLAEIDPLLPPPPFWGPQEQTFPAVLAAL